MDPLAVSDVFKFLAVRPAQRVSEADTLHTVIRDARAGERAGVRELVALAGELARADAALSRWKELDLSPLASCVEGRRELIRHYETLRAGDVPADGRKILQEAGLAKGLNEPRILRLAWDALYVADSTGASAGPRFEVPLAALRVLHYARLLDEQKSLPRAAALEALRATPAIPHVFYDARLALAAVPATTVPPGATPSEDATRAAHVRQLAQDLVATERILGLLTGAPAASAPSTTIGPTTELPGGWYRSELRLERAPTAHATLAGQLSRDEAALLDRLRVVEGIPVSALAQKLETHLSALSRQALTLEGDVSFQSQLRDLSSPLSSGAARKTGLVQADADVISVIGTKTMPDVDVSGRIIPLGIGDLKVVKQTLLAYVPGEVAHIENVLKGESKERKHRKLDRTETTLFTAEEETKETQRDTQSTDRFELKRETEQTIKDDMSIKAGLTVTASYGPVVATATGEFAYSTAKEDSQKSSSNFARELVERSVSKVQTKTKLERTTKTLNEVEEINTHGLINTEPGAEHIVGIYRWVDKRYRAQVYNYGVRLLLEFVVPEPAAFVRMTLGRRGAKVNASPPPPFENLRGDRLSAVDITAGTYQVYVSRYNAAGVSPPPAVTVCTSVTLVKDGGEPEKSLGKSIGIASTDKLVIPPDYRLWSYVVAASYVWGGGPQFSVLVGGDLHSLETSPSGSGRRMTTTASGTLQDPEARDGTLPVSVTAYDVTAFAVNVELTCMQTPRAMEKWRLETFDKIFAAYQALQTAYDQKVAQAEAAQGPVIQGRNPAANRVIEKTELKKLCITMMTGQHFDRFHAMTDPPDKPTTHPEVDVFQALEEGRIEQFIEQAFEWEQMTYLFYPYFWGRKKNWLDVSLLSDPDPLFAQFLGAGAARVVVPVPLAYADAVQFMLREPGKDLGKKVWRGGERPTIEDENGLYVSITDELRNQTDDLGGAKPEGTAWEFTLPTTLVWLQPDATLPTFE